jgi:hypothetical protein
MTFYWTQPRSFVKAKALILIRLHAGHVYKPLCKKKCLVLRHPSQQDVELRLGIASLVWLQKAFTVLMQENGINIL